MNRLKRALPWISLAAALIAIVCAVIGIPQRQQYLVDNGVTRAAAEAELDQVVVQQPSALNDPDFLQVVKDLPGNAYIVYTWLFDSDGRILFTSARSAYQGNAAEHATMETQRLLSTLPSDALTDEQQTLLLAASAIQSEGEHNDVFRHMIREVRSPDGVLLGWIGVTYEVNPDIGKPDLGYIFSLLVWLISMGIYWLSLPLWVWIDARTRGERAKIWTLFVLVGNLAALMAYLLTRDTES